MTCIFIISHTIKPQKSTIVRLYVCRARERERKGVRVRERERERERERGEREREREREILTCCRRHSPC